MLYPLRILLIGLTVMSVTSQSLQPGAAATDPDGGSSYQQRCERLAGQLEQLRSSVVPPDAIAPGRQAPQMLCAPEHQQQKTALLANALNALVALQVDNAALGKPQSGAGYLAVQAPPPAWTAYNTVEMREPQEAVAFFQIDDPAVPEEETADTVEDVAEDEAIAEEDAAEAPPAPMPPAPRVQTSDQVRESQESLVRQFRGLMKAVSAGADPMYAASAQSQGTAEVETPLITAPIVEAEDASEPVEPDRPAPVRERTPYGGDPMEQLVDIDFRDVDLTNVVAILALKADINIIAGAELRGVVTANLRQVPLRVAMETALRMNGLGLVEEDGIYFIIPYEEAASVNRKTAMVTLEKAEATDVKKILDDIISGIRDEAVINISANRNTNTLVISAPRARVDELVAMAHQLDVAEPKLPTVTEAIALNYSEPQKLVPMLKNMLTDKVGDVAADERARQIVVTDLPVVVEQIQELVKKLDVPTRQVLIETMVVDAVLNDEADTGVQWLLESVRRMSRRQAALGDNGRAVGNLQELSLLSDMEVLQNAGSLLNFGVLTGSIDWRGMIQMEVRNRNAHLVSNPVVLTLENESAEISISQEIPYIELSQTSAGGSQTSTRFKEVGTVLVVTPRVTHDNTIITTIEGKESNLAGQFQGIPIEDKREIMSTMRMGNGQTIFVGGLRKSSANSSARKIPVLGDVPIVNFMFRSNQRTEQINELLVFLTCSVIDSEYPELTPYQREAYEKAPPIVPRVDAWETTMYEVAHPEVSKEFQKTWRRGS
ncbi:MAG TPA: hypothetical protein ENN29_13130 [Candidatus Hydrogenedentes bacterium]|nr:hypothetical protein [Candidatus Hydrogenedentota bacterium]